MADDTGIRQEWHSAAELASLPGMPSTVQKINIRAKRERWQSRPRQGQGGGREYHIEALPRETRVALALDNRARPKRAQHPNATDPARTRADAKTAILAELATFRRQSGLGRIEAFDTFATAYEQGRVNLDAWVHDMWPTVSARSLRRWEDTAAKSGTKALGGRYGNRKGSGVIDTDQDLRDHVLGMLASYPHFGAKHIMRTLRQQFPERKLPSYRSMQRWLTAWRYLNRAEVALFANPDDHRNRYRPSFGSASEGAGHLNALWEMDSTPADIMLQDGRHTVVGAIDVFSRRGKLLVSRSSTAEALCSLLRRTILDFGVPDAIKVDNGSDYISIRFTRALLDLGIDQLVCPPFTPEAKPHIERFLGTMSRDLLEMLPGYIGHSVTDRKGIEARRSFAQRFGADDRKAVEIALTAEELQAQCDAWCENEYARAVHSGLQGRTPFEVYQAAAAGRRIIDDERALDMLLADAPDGRGTRRVGKKGIQLDRTHFIAPALGGLIGERVHVRYDPDDLGRIVVYDVEDSTFICLAEAPERTGISRQEIAIKARHVVLSV